MHHLITSIPLPITPNDDKLIWAHSKDSNYNVKYGYLIARNKYRQCQVSSPASTSTDLTKIWNLLWQAKVITSIKIFWWRIVRNYLSTKANLHFRHLAPDDIC